ncbi:MAG TPA: chromate transporter, partial [Sphingomonas sp.]|nr:chromate transporter [Sphingomonas sp.]
GAFVLIFFFDAPFPLIVFGAGLIGYLGGRNGYPGFGNAGAGEASGNMIVHDADTLLGTDLPPHARPTRGQAMRSALLWLLLWLMPVAALLFLLGPDNVFSRIAAFFSTMAVATFGGAYAALAYVAQEAVQSYHWLSPREMLDGLGMAETTPGPLIMVLQFVGFLAAYRDPGALPPLLAGTLGGLLATWVTFMPCFLWIFLGAPFVERLRGNIALGSALAAITAAVVGVIIDLAFWFAIHTIFRATLSIRAGPLHFDLPVLARCDPWALLLSAGAIVAMFRLKAGALVTLAATSTAGIALHLVGAIA